MRVEIVVRFVRQNVLKMYLNQKLIPYDRIKVSESSLEVVKETKETSSPTLSR